MGSFVPGWTLYCLNTFGLFVTSKNVYTPPTIQYVNIKTNHDPKKSFDSIIKKIIYYSGREGEGARENSP